MSLINEIINTFRSSSAAAPVHTDAALGVKANPPDGNALGLLERCMSSTTTACSSLKGKVVSFASNIMASVSDLCSRLFGLEAKSTAGSVSAASGAQASHDSKMAVLNEASNLLKAAAKEKTTGLFRIGGLSVTPKEIKALMDQGKAINFSSFGTADIASFYKEQFALLALEKAPYEELIKLVLAKEGGADEKAVSLEVTTQFISHFSDDDAAKVKLMLGTFSACYAETSDASGSDYTPIIFDTIVAARLIPDSVYTEMLSRGSKAILAGNNDAAKLLKILMESFKPA